MNVNSKYIAIDDAIGKFRIVDYGVVFTPLRKLRLTSRQIHTAMITFRGPKFIYAIDPNDDRNRIRLTEENYMLSEEELFGEKPVVEEVKEVVDLTNETMTLDDLPAPQVAKEPEVVEETPVVEEPVAAIEEVPVIVEEPVVETVAEPVVEEVVAEKQDEDDFDDLKVTPVEEPVVEEAPVQVPEQKPQSNNNNYKQNNNNNGQKKYSYNGNNYHKNNNHH